MAMMERVSKNGETVKSVKSVRVRNNVRKKRKVVQQVVQLFVRRRPVC